MVNMTSEISLCAMLQPPSLLVYQRPFFSFQIHDEIHLFCVNLCTIQRPAQPFKFSWCFSFQFWFFPPFCSFYICWHCSTTTAKSLKPYLKKHEWCVHRKASFPVQFWNQLNWKRYQQPWLRCYIPTTQCVTNLLTILLPESTSIINQS